MPSKGPGSDARVRSHAAQDSISGWPPSIEQSRSALMIAAADPSPSEPLVLAVTQHDNVVQVRLQIQPELCWFDGHFPEQPILPGVLQTHWAIEFGRRYLPLPAQFRSMSNMKFMRFILPGTQLELRLQYVAAKSELVFEYHDGVAVCASGRIGFGDESGT